MKPIGAVRLSWRGHGGMSSFWRAAGRLSLVAGLVLALIPSLSFA